LNPPTTRFDLGCCCWAAGRVVVVVVVDARAASDTYNTPPRR
jgi:hypothetical protein